MGLSDRKIEIAIFTFAVVMVGGMGYLLKAPVQNAIAGADFSYEMPRPKNSFLAALFDLAGRDVERKYVNPFAKKKAEEKKAEEAKKAATVAAAKAATKAVAKKADENKKPKVDVQVVGADTSVKWGDDGFSNNSSGPRNSYNNAGGGTGVPGDVGNTGKDKPEELTSNEWKDLFATQPTQANMTKLIAAFAARQVDTETFYAIVMDLMDSNKPENQSLALMGLKSAYNAKSFALTAQYRDQLTPEMQTDADAYLMTYANSSRLGILAFVLKGTDVVAMMEAFTVVRQGYEAALNGTPVKVPDRNLRGDVATNSLASYNQFIPIFQELAGNPDSSIASLANELLGHLQPTVATL